MNSVFLYPGFNNPTFTGNATFTGQGLFADGTLLLPSIAFSSEPSLGFYRPSAGMITATKSFSIVGLFTLPGGQIHQLSGHNFLQGDATHTYLYGGTAGIDFRKSDNSISLVTLSDTGSMVFNAGSVTASVGGFTGFFNLNAVSNFGIGLIHTIGGHSFVQGNATLTFFYGGTGGIQIRKSDNSVDLFTISDTGAITTTGVAGISKTQTPVTSITVVNGIVTALT